jgi:hypothetical protein
MTRLTTFDRRPVTLPDHQLLCYAGRSRACLILPTEQRLSLAAALGRRVRRVHVWPPTSVATHARPVLSRRTAWSDGRFSGR